MSPTEAVLAGAQPEALRYVKEIRGLFKDKSQTLSNIEQYLLSWKEMVKNDPDLSPSSLEALIFEYDLNISFLQNGQRNGAVLVDDIEILVGMHCGAALFFYAAGLIAVCALTAGTAAVVVAATWVGFGGSVWSLFENC